METPSFLPDIKDESKKDEIKKMALHLHQKAKFPEKLGDLSDEETKWLEEYRATRPKAPPKKSKKKSVSDDGPPPQVFGGAAANSESGPSSDSKSTAERAGKKEENKGQPPPIDLKGNSNGRKTTEAEHQQYCLGLSRQFVGMLHAWGTHIKKIGGQAIPDGLLEQFIGPASYRLAIKYVPRSGEIQEGADGLVCGLAISYLGYQHWTIVRSKKNAMDTTVVTDPIGMQQRPVTK